jgi:medium-chain acyl-[acyl-carrier-protein] hydrolase
MRHSDWIVLPQPRPHASLRLFCFPFAGGGASAYGLWPRLLPPDVEVLCIQLPGRENRFREAPIADVAVVLDQLDLALRDWIGKPYVFFGHSLGGLLAYELTRRFHRDGRRLPRQLVVSGKRAPQFPPRRVAISTLGDGEFIREIVNYDGTAPSLLEDREFMEFVLPRLRADAALFDFYQYQAGPRVPCPIVAFGGDADVHVNEAELLGWRDLTSGGFSSKVFSGGHFFIQQHQALVMQELARLLTDEVCA